MPRPGDSFTKLAGVPVHYDRRFEGDYGTRGESSRFYVTAEFHGILEAFFTELWEICPLGKAEVITSAGAYVYKPPSLHATGEAFDLDGIFWGNKTFTTLNYPKDKKFYLGVEAILRKHLGTVLDYHYNASHRDHFHIDIGTAVGFRRVTSITFFLQAALKEVFNEFVTIDGIYGNETDGALKRVLEQLKITGSLRNDDNWMKFLTETGRAAFAAPEGAVTPTRTIVTETSNPSELLQEVYAVLAEKLADNEARKNIEAALNHFAQNSETETWLKQFQKA